MAAQEIETAKLAYFVEGNTYTGSRTKDPAAGAILRYRLVPDRENSLLQVACWDRDVCYEKAEPQEREFPLEAEGLEAARSWLAEQYARIGQEG